MTPEQEATSRDLMQALYFARNKVAEAERLEQQCEQRVIEFMVELEQPSIKSAEHHFTATRTVRRTPRVSSQERFMEALTEIGQVPRYRVKKELDSKWLLELADHYDGDWPGLDVKVTEYLTVTGSKR